MVTFELGYFYKNISCMLKVSYFVDMLKEFYNGEHNEELVHDIDVINAFIRQSRTYRLPNTVSELAETILKEYNSCYTELADSIVSEYKGIRESGVFYNVVKFMFSTPMWCKKFRDGNRDIDYLKGNLSYNFYGEFFIRFLKSTRKLDEFSLNTGDYVFESAWGFIHFYLLEVFILNLNINFEDEEVRKKFLEIFHEKVKFSLITGMEITTKLKLPVTYRELLEEISFVKAKTKKKFIIQTDKVNKQSITFKINDVVILYDLLEKLGYWNFQSLLKIKSILSTKSPFGNEEITTYGNKTMDYNTELDRRKNMIILRVNSHEKSEKYCEINLMVSGQRALSLLFALDSKELLYFSNLHRNGAGISCKLPLYVLKAVLLECEGVIKRSNNKVYKNYIKNYGRKKNNRVDVANIILLAKLPLKERNDLLNKYIKDSEKISIYKSEVVKLNKAIERYRKNNTKFAFTKVCEVINRYVR